MNAIDRKVDWSLVDDRDIPLKRVSTGVLKKHKNYFYMPSTEQVGVANALGRNCLAVYVLLTTAQAIHPREIWHKLPSRQLQDTGMDRYKIRRAMKKLVAAGIVESDSKPGRKTRYRLIGS